MFLAVPKMVSFSQLPTVKKDAIFGAARKIFDSYFVCDSFSKSLTHKLPLKRSIGRDFMKTIFQSFNIFFFVLDPIYCSRIPLTILAAASADDVSMACIINKNPVQHWLYLDGGSKNNCCLPSRQDSNPHAYGFLKVTKIQTIFFIRQKNFDLQKMSYCTELFCLSYIFTKCKQIKIHKTFSGRSVWKRSFSKAKCAKHILYYLHLSQHIANENSCFEF